MADFSEMRLGKKAARVDARTLKLGRYLPVTLPPAPDELSWTSAITDWGMMGNDVLGDCTIAGAGHAVQTWTAATGPEVTPPDGVVVSYYSNWAGYVPGDSSTDNGAVMLDVLNHWRKEGFYGYSIKAYADPDVMNVEHIKQSIYLYGLIYIGVQLPLSAMKQDVWSVVQGPDSEPGSWGGHAIICNAYNKIGPVCITWGAKLQMTWEFFQKYCDEAHTILAMDWLTWAPNDYHFLGDLDNDLALVTQ